MPRAKRETAQKAREKRKTDATDDKGGAKKVKQDRPAKQETESAVSVERNAVCGSVLVVGQGDVGQLGLGPDVFEKTRPAVVPEISDVVDVVAGGMHTLCLTKSGEVFSFGCNDEGALGRATSSTDGSESVPGKVDLPELASRISAGDSHSAALTASGVAYVWGNFRDSSGSMGLTRAGTPEPKPQRLMDGVVQIASGSDHLALLREDGSLYTLGCGEQGQLGRVPSYFSFRGGRKGLDYLLTPGRVVLRQPRGCKSRALDAVWTGSYCTFVRLRESGTLYGFGLNNFHQLGLAGEEEAGVEFKPRLLTACLGHKWQKLSGGQHHTLLLNENGEVFSVGRKEYGRLGHGPNCPDQKHPKKLEGLPSCTDVSCGNVVSFAVSTAGNVYSWGMGTNAQLGHGDDEDVYEPKMVAGKAISTRKALLVSGGGQHAIILATDS